MYTYLSVIIFRYAHAQVVNACLIIWQCDVIYVIIHRTIFNENIISRQLAKIAKLPKSTQLPSQAEAKCGFLSKRFIYNIKKDRFIYVGGEAF